MNQATEATADSDMQGPVQRSARPSRLRFSIFTMLATVSMVAAAFWLFTQAGIETTSYELLEINATPVDDSTGQTKAFELHKFSYRLQSLDKPRYPKRIIHLSPPLICRTLPDQEQIYLVRYRKHPVLGLPPEDVHLAIMRQLGVSPSQVQQMMEEYIVE